MVVLTSEVFFDLQGGQGEAEAVIDSLIAELQVAKVNARKGELRVGAGGLVENPHNEIAE